MRGCEGTAFSKNLCAADYDVRSVGRRTELVLIPSGPGRMRIVSPQELSLGEV